MKKLSVLALSMLFVLGLATTAFAASFNSPTTTVTITDSNKLNTVANGVGADDVNDNTYKNANYTGSGVGGNVADFSGVIKSKNVSSYANTRVDATNPGTIQRTHGEYQNNTNSCASCHQTHTAAGQDLLFKNSVYNTCTACHDGTLGFYNVFNASTAGTFGGTADGGASMHLASGAVQIKAAPGGNTAADRRGGWTNNFSCNSCHTPHGSYSSRLLHFNPNDMADVATKDGGQKLVQAFGTTASTIATTYPATSENAGVSYVVYDTVANIVYNGYTGAYATDNAIQNGTYNSAAVTAAGGKIVAVVTCVQDPGDKKYKYMFDTTPWLYEYEYNSVGTKVLYTGFWKTTVAANPDPTTADYLQQVKQSSNGVNIYTPDYQNAFAYGDFTGANTAGIGRDIITKLPVNYNITDTTSGFVYGAVYGKFYSSTKYSDATTDGTHIKAGTGVTVSNFCAACHTDYLVSEAAREDGAGATDGTGMYTQAFRHTTNSDSYMCLRCHFAHGTDVSVMTDAMDRGLTKVGKDGKNAVDYFIAQGDSADTAVADATAYLKDTNPSSALKRYTNMAVCWKCHTSSHSAGFQNTDYYKDLGYTGGTTMTKSTSTIPSGF